ncbi:uncharacterized protein V1510DRAFT_408886 [Dipodascopsis tothii]|uniref:uncharacterized protein n=1 Tax=Dipodascopsis tothii TaxID=44089 RepID=UPI0034CF735D
MVAGGSGVLNAGQKLSTVEAKIEHGLSGISIDYLVLTVVGALFRLAFGLAMALPSAEVQRQYRNRYGQIWRQDGGRIPPAQYWAEVVYALNSLASVVGVLVVYPVLTVTRMQADTRGLRDDDAAQLRSRTLRAVHMVVRHRLSTVCKGAVVLCVAVPAAFWLLSSIGRREYRGVDPAMGWWGLYWLDVVESWKTIDDLIGYARHLPQVSVNCDEESTRGLSVSYVKMLMRVGVIGLAAVACRQMLYGFQRGLQPPYEMFNSVYLVMLSGLFLLQHLYFYRKASKDEERRENISRGKDDEEAMLAGELGSDTPGARDAPGTAENEALRLV